MKKFLFILMIAVTGGAMKCAAQDVIVKKDGSTIVSKVLEITSTEVKYKKFTNLQGPTYTVAKTELQAINYENGEKETFTSTASTDPLVIQSQQSVSDMALLQMAGDPELNLQQKIKRLRKAGWIVGGTLVAGGLSLIVGGLADDDEFYFPGLVSGGVSCAAGVIISGACLISAHYLEKRNRLSVYNAPLYQKDFTFSNGTSLTTGVDILKDNRFHSQTLGIGIRYHF